MRLSREASRQIGKSLRENIETAQSWEDVEIAAALEGLELQPKGQGLSLTQGREYARFSDLGRFSTMQRLEAKFGETIKACEGWCGARNEVLLTAMAQNLRQLARSFVEAPRQPPSALRKRQVPLTVGARASTLRLSHHGAAE